MVSAALRFSVLGAVLSLIVGCGGSSGNGGSGGGSNNPTVVTFTITGVAPTAVAIKVGSGPFTPAMLTSGAATITLPKGETNFAVAYVCRATYPPNGLTGSESAEQDVFEANTLDGTSFGGTCLAGLAVAPTTPETGELTGSVDISEIPGATTYSVYAGEIGVAGAILGLDPGPNFGIQGVAGMDRVLVAAYKDINNPIALETSGFTLIAAKSLDSQPVPGALNGGNTVVFAAPDQTTTEAITYNLPSGFKVQDTSASFLTGAGGGIVLSSPAIGQYPALPEGAIEKGDYYSVTASAWKGQDGSGITKTFTTAAPVVFAFPPDWSYSGPTPAALPTFDLAYSGFSGPSGVGYFTETYSGQSLYIVNATANYLNGASSIAYPDLSDLPGFLPLPLSGTYVGWDAAITQTVHDSQSSSPKDETVTSVTVSGNYQVP